jgi:hypothetical protein
MVQGLFKGLVLILHKNGAWLGFFWKAVVDEGKDNDGRDVFPDGRVEFKTFTPSLQRS